jgi:hypothetical protein
MNRFRTSTTALLFCVAPLLSVACEPNAEPTRQNLSLTGQISQNIVPPAGTATLTFRLENVSDESVTLRFTTGCQILPFIATRERNFIVYPSGGEWGCTTVISELILRPGGSTTQEVVVFAATPLSLPPPGTVPLATGEYSAYARIEATGIDIQSISVPFDVQ